MPAPLEPILLDAVGRGGSTAAMQLLRSSPQIVVPGPFPYERRYFTFLRRWAEALEASQWSSELWGQEELASTYAGHRQRGLVGPPPWFPRELFEAPGPGRQGGEPAETFSERMFRLAWAELSERARRAAEPQLGGEPQPRYLAEKLADIWRVGIGAVAPARVVVLTRDPRDTFVSIEAFNRRRGRPGFGRQAHPGEEEYLRFFVERHRARLAWAVRVRDQGAAPVLRYEDLARDPDAFAARLGAALGVELDAAALADPAQRADHATSPGTLESVGRWRRELDPGVAGLLGDVLGEELSALGYER